MPKIDLDALPEINSTNYPTPFDTLVKGRFRKRLGDAGGLNQFGVNLTRVEPGSASAQRHWHQFEDEFVYIVSGEATLIEDEGECQLGPGDAAAFKAGDPNGHHIVNRSDADVVFLEIGTRSNSDAVDYPDIDLRLRNGTPPYLHRDGTPYRENE